MSTLRWLSIGQGPFDSKPDPEIVSVMFADCPPDPVQADQKPPAHGMYALNSLEQALNFQKRYAARIKAVMGWLGNALPGFRYEINVAMMRGQPSDAYTWFGNAVDVFGEDEDGRPVALRTDLIATLLSPDTALTTHIQAGFASRDHDDWVEPSIPVVIVPASPPTDSVARFGPPADSMYYPGARLVAADNTATPGTHAVADSVQYVYHVLKAGLTGVVKLWIPVGLE